jgi:Holliday junction resolvasome RuvABC ATP-dependent DNA helicase subunit
MGQDYFKDIYSDFFEKSLIQEESITNSQEEFNQEQLKEKVKDISEQIDDLYITHESKDILKRIIAYMQRYRANVEKKYIPFNLCICSKEPEITTKIIQILEEANIQLSYLKRGKKQEISLYKVEELKQIEEIYSEKSNIIVIKDFEEINNKEIKLKEAIMHEIEMHIKNTEEKDLTIIVSSKKEHIENLKDSLFVFEIDYEKPEVQEVYQEVLNNLQENSYIEDQVQPKLIDYIAATYPKTDLTYSEYRDRLINKILFSKNDRITTKDIPDYEKEKTLDEIFKELNELVGLSKVKQVLNELVNLIELKEKSKGELNIKSTNLHMVFLGNPGTGKTTVARLIAQILYNLKYIKQNKLIEVSSKDLVAEYVGQTGPKTMAIIEKAKGGVLFIDEAYTLASSSGTGNSYNEEAIATLIQEMENNRDNLVVIFAGYTREMQAFLNSNSGIVSRIGYTLEFEDYTEQELLEIFKLMLKKAGFKITEQALNKAEKLIREAKMCVNFGNARFVRNMYEKTVIKHASNTKGKKQKNILKTIEEQDINIENLS